MVDETPTPRESGAVGRADAWVLVADHLVEGLLAEAARCARVGSTDIQRGTEARMLASEVRGCREAFEAWLRGEATREQQVADHRRWVDVQRRARELGVR